MTLNDYLIYASLGLIVFLTVINALVYKKLRVWKVIIGLFTIGVYAALLYSPVWIPYVSRELVNEYYIYWLYFVVLILAVSFKNKIKITQNLTDYDFFEIEKELDETRSSSELLRLRYISTIGLIQEGLIFYDQDLNGLFVTEQFLKLTDTKQNNFSMEDYVNMIHEDDQQSYLQNIKKIGKKYPSLEMKYRIKRNNGYVWIVENIRSFDFDKKTQILSSVRGLDIKLFPETMIHEIDSLPQESQFIQYLTQIMKDTEPFYVIMFHLTNIPDINQRFGRDVGNLMIAEYIKKMRYNFAKDVNSIFRITGIQFALIIREQRKYDVLARALQSGGDLINLSMNIGGIQQVVYPNLGIIKKEPWSTYSVNEIVNFSNKALMEAIKSPKRNYSVFGD